MNNVPVNWFGAFLIVRELLAWSKAGQTDNNADSFIAKLNRPNLVARAQLVLSAIHNHGPTVEAARIIQAGGAGYFTGVSEEALADALGKAVARLKKGGVWKFSPAEFGSLVFETTSTE